MVWGDGRRRPCVASSRCTSPVCASCWGPTGSCGARPATSSRYAPGELDLDDFAEAVERARRTAAGDAARLADGLRAALAMWSGPVVGGTPESLLSWVAPALRERRSAVLEELFEAEIVAGRYAEVVGELVQATRDHPFREVLHGLLMSALHRAGRTAEALEVYAALRDGLADELGVEPGARLQDVRREVLQGTSAAADVSPDPAPATRRPAQLRRAGRAAGQPRRAARRRRRTGPHRRRRGHSRRRQDDPRGALVPPCRQLFPDGQLYVNLRGFDTGGGRGEPAEAVRGFLDAFAVPPERPGRRRRRRWACTAHHRGQAGPDGARQRPRRRAGPAAAARAVRLPRAGDQPRRARRPGCRRGRVPDALDLPSDDEAREMFVRRLGADRVAAETEAVRGTSPPRRGCRWPWPSSPPARPTTRTSRSPRSPGSWPTGRRSGPVRRRRPRHRPARGAVRLVPDARARRGAGLPPAEPAPRAGHHRARRGQPRRSSAAAGPPRGRRTDPGQSPDRAGPGPLYLSRPAPRVRGRARPRWSEQELHTAWQRLLDHYLNTALVADRLLNPQRDPITPPPPAPGVAWEEFPGHEQAMAWFTAETRPWWA